MKSRLIKFYKTKRTELVIPIFLKKAFNGEPITIAGDGKYRNFIYAEDVANGVIPIRELFIKTSLLSEGFRKKLMNGLKKIDFRKSKYN